MGGAVYEKDPLIEAVSAKSHEGWMAMKAEQGITSRKSEIGEELMVPYADLSEPAKDLDRGAVKATIAALEAAGYAIAKKETV